MIRKIHAKSRTADISATATSVLTDCTKRDFSADPYMTFQIGKLNDSNELMTEALNETVANSILAPIDDKRDNNLRVIYYEVDAKELWTNVTISAAAAVVAEEIDKYGFEIIDMAYATESANINALLRDLKKKKVAEAIAILPDLSDLIKELEASQEEFETAYLQLVDLKIEKEKLISATKLGRVMREQINTELIVYLNGMSRSMPDTFKDCAEVVGTVIADNNSKVRNRLKKAAKDQSAKKKPF